MSLGQEQELFAKDVALLLAKAWELGFAVRLGEVQRPLEMQQIYVKTGRSKTMNSMHIKKCAIDLVLLLNSKVCGRLEILPLGQYWESLSSKNRWGGSWRGLVDSGKSSFVDAPHFERMA
jgi:peptidoglycan L-alanyl-D-glutamate endopeptidase CwlK